MSIILICQNIGAAVALPVANAIFSNTLRRQLQECIEAFGVDPDVIVGSGVRSIRAIVSGDQLSATLQAYCNSIDIVMYLGIAVAVAAFALALKISRRRKSSKTENLRSRQTASKLAALFKIPSE
ncbi:hypothetical protein K449DRAFT_442967 [Hypoxylon sp. EC38]|nr:hypothetical protein K449DRAFT_442967 [Hypoxylon sp. EC38]